MKLIIGIGWLWAWWDFGLIELKTNRLRANRLGRIDA